jgi:hypothetical protein
MRLTIVLLDGRSNSRKRRRGPRGAGKSRASRKTLRRGLAAITRHNPTLFPDIERMANPPCSTTPTMQRAQCRGAVPRRVG